MNQEAVQQGNDKDIADAVNAVTKEGHSASDNVGDFLRRVSKQFIENKLEKFPEMCDVFRVQVKLEQDKLREAGNPQGWSENKSIKLETVIPQELYNFMTNLVYRDFWSDENARVWRPFLRAILRGDNAMETLMKVKSLYGSTVSAEKAGIV